MALIFCKRVMKLILWTFFYWLKRNMLHFWQNTILHISLVFITNCSLWASPPRFLHRTKDHGSSWFTKSVSVFEHLCTVHTEHFEATWLWMLAHFGSPFNQLSTNYKFILLISEISLELYFAMFFACKPPKRCQCTSCCCCCQSCSSHCCGFVRHDQWQVTLTSK